MDRRLIAFLLLIGVLIVAQIYMIERFYGGSSNDCSGSDCSGSSRKGDITMSLSDLLTLLSSKKPDVGSGLSTKKYENHRKEILEPTGDMLYDATGDVYYSSLKDDILDEIKSSVHDEVAANRTLLIGSADDSSSCSSSCSSGCESFATMQGSGFIKRKGVEYVRTDSIPCYGCSLK
jgi:hypothetical protein